MRGGAVGSSPRGVREQMTRSAPASASLHRIMRVSAFVMMAALFQTFGARAKVETPAKVIACSFTETVFSAYENSRWSHKSSQFHDIETITDLDRSTRTAMFTNAFGGRVQAEYIRIIGSHYFSLVYPDLQIVTLTVLDNRDDNLEYPAFKTTHSNLLGAAVEAEFGTCSITR